jgi:DNA-binding CsgD family transcriptional regulator/PAS domain-containing protein
LRVTAAAGLKKKQADMQYTIDLNRFDEVISSFYEAAFGKRSWEQSLNMLAQSLGAWSVSVTGIARPEAALRFMHVGGTFNRDLVVTYLRDWHPRNPRIERLAGLQVGQWMHCHQHFSDAFVSRDPFYQKFLLPNGARWFSGCKLLQDDKVTLYWTVTRAVERQPFAASDVPLLDRIRQHLLNALSIERHMNSHRSEFHAGRAMLSRSSQPVALVDEDRNLLFVNEQARSLIAEGEGLHERAGKLACKHVQDEQALAGALRALQLSASPAPDGRFAAPSGVYHRLRGSAGGLGLYLVAVRPAAALRTFGRQPVAMVVMHRPDARIRLDPFVLEQAFGLTPAETRVAMLLAQGDSAEEATERLHVSMATVRSHIKSLFHKTGTHRQPDLVRVVNALSDIELPQAGASRLAA